MKKEDKPYSCWHNLDLYLEEQETLNDPSSKSFSIIIPTLNSAETLSVTLEKILEQNYTNYEVLIIDANSKDRTQEIILSYHSSNFRLHTVAEYHRFEMINRGITLAKGEYINVLFPGDFYRAKHVLSHISQLAFKNKNPELIYCGSLLRLPRKKVPYPFLHDLSAYHLKNGRQPSTLPSCWFRKETLKKLGKFNPHYPMRSSLDFFCRFYFSYHGSCIKTNRILLDRDKQSSSQKILIHRLFDTFHILCRHIGFLGAVKWLIKDRESWQIFLQSFWKIKTAFYR